MAKTQKGKMDHQQKSHTSCLVATIKQLISTKSKEFIPPVFSLRWIHKAASHNSNILAAFNGNLGEALEAYKGSPLDYGSEFRDFTGIANIFCHHEDRYKIM